MNIARYIMLMRCTRYPSKRIEVDPRAKGREIVNKLITTHLPGLPIIAGNRREVTGVVTEFNVLGALREGMDPDSFTAERIMTGHPVTAELDTPVEELIETMLENNFTMIPVTKNGQLAGIIDRCSIMELLISPALERYSRI
ncbi:MAG: CBS domain-containing protein [Nitrospiraceae bacterium]|nr:MAG: CBS domain-containing protein [Nitrospiraceae bacterium]